MNIEKILTEHIVKASQELYGNAIEASQLSFQKTRKEFKGDSTLVTFALTKLSKKSPDATAADLGEYLLKHESLVTGYNVVKGFLNIELSNKVFTQNLSSAATDICYGKGENSGKTYIVEYASPNTNKPLHLGHLRNIFLGYSVAEILKACGHQVIKAQIINDRGIHICKSMLAWKKEGKNATPESTGMKGDKLVGHYYVEFDKQYKAELKDIEEKAKEIYESRLVTEGLNKSVSEIEGEKSSAQLNAQKSKSDAMFESVAVGFGVGLLTKYLTKKSEGSWALSALAGLALGLLHNSIKNETIDNELKRKYDELESTKKESIKLTMERIRKELNSENLKYKSQDFKLIIEELKNNSPLIQEAQEMLLKWEAGDEETVSLWKKMNSWVYDGFDVTYKSINVDFDKLYYESDTYILGKNIVEVGLEKKVFYKKEDGSVWIDLTADGLDEKLLLRADGTSVYITQDIGTAVERYKDFPQVNGMIYTVGNEQDYHFKVLFLILKKMGYAWANECSHLSYGMVDLPSGKMKSREGTVVDADDIVNEMDTTAEKTTRELGKLDLEDIENPELLFHQIGQAALKYFILKVDPKKRMLFDSKESIDFQGNTGPYLQYTNARLSKVISKANCELNDIQSDLELAEVEREIMKLIADYPSVVQEAGKNHSPAVLANYLYELVKLYNQFYQLVPILKEENPDKRNFRLVVCKATGNVLKNGLKLLGIEAPERM